MILGSMKKTERLSIDEKLWKLLSVSVTTAKNIKKEKIMKYTDHCDKIRKLWNLQINLGTRLWKSQKKLWNPMRRYEKVEIWNEMKNEQ